MKSLINSIYPYLSVFFVFILPLDKYAAAAPNIVLILLIACFPFVIQKKHLTTLKKIPSLLFLGLVAFLFLNSLFVTNLADDFSVLKKILGALTLFLLFIPIDNIKKIYGSFIYSALVCIIVSVYHLYFFYMKEGAFNFANGAVINDVLIIDRLYLGILCVLSIVSSIYLMGNNYKSENKYYLANILLNVLFVLLISSRLAILLIVCLFILKVFYSKKPRKYIAFSIGIVVVIIGAFIFNKNLQDRFLYTYYGDVDESYITLLKKSEPRVIIWSCAKKIASNQNPLVGIGFYETKNQLVACYDEIVVPERRRNYFVKSRFNTHNQFFDFYLSAGIIAVIIFILLLLQLFKKNIKKYTPTALLVTVTLFMMLECLFHRQIGSYYFAIILVLLIKETIQDKHLTA